MPLIQKDTNSKWIDFWVICDKTKAYLFYTESQSIVMVRITSLEEFPGGWGEGKNVFSGVTEAAHIYKVTGQNEYHMIYELNRGGMRSFGLAAAKNLTGPWEKVTDRFATGEQLRYLGDNEPWRNGFARRGDTHRLRRADGIRSERRVAYPRYAEEGLA